MTCHLFSEANAALKEKHEVMYNHQLQYDQQLATSLMDAKMALNDMRGEVWATVHPLAENEGIMFNACLSLMLQVLSLLPQIPIDISFQTQIPLTITYCLESSICRRWCPEQGGVSPLCKAWAGLPANLVRVWIIPHLWLLLTTPQDQADHGALDVDLVAVHEVSLLPSASDQALWAQWQVVIPFFPTLLKMARCQAVSLNPPTMREMALEMMTMPKKTRVGLRPQVMDRWHQMA